MFPINHIVDSRIQEYISSDHMLEIVYYFSQELLTEEEFNQQAFSLAFRKKWFTYGEYRSHWEDVHPKLIFYKICRVLAHEIIFNDLITLDEFKSEEVYEQLRDSLIKSILTDSEYKTFQRHQSSLLFSRLKYNCVILNYRSCRDYKFEVLENANRARAMLKLYYYDCLEDALGIFIKGNLKLDSFIEVMDEINCPEITIPTRDVITQECQVVDTQQSEESDIELPVIEGEYVEPFKNPYGKLHVRAKSASINFYFPGPDARYNGTFFYIDELDIDKYIKAYQTNWELGVELQAKIQELPQSELRKTGDQSMNIRVTKTLVTLYIHQYCLPISSYEECKEMIKLFKLAKLRIDEIRNKLFC